MTNHNTARGVVRGRTIELSEDPRIEDGRVVEVTIRPEIAPEAQIEAIRRTAGSMVDSLEFATAMDEVERQRHEARFRDQAG